MIRKSTFFVASLCIILGGCGGGGGDGGNNGPEQQGPVPTVIGPVQAVPNPTYGDTRRAEAFQRVNEIRKLLGLGLLAQNTKVDVAAQSHANYLAQNGGSHSEDPAKPGFTGVSPGDRVTAAGYDSSTGAEVLTVSPGTASAQVDGYINTLYHRIPFVAYDFIDIGVGSAVSPRDSSVYVSVLVFAKPSGVLGQEAPAVPFVVWPLRNATISSGAVENENPPPPGAGYPVTITFDPRKVVTVSKFELRESGSVLLPATVLTSSSDPYSLIPRSMIALSPRDVLKPSTSYTVVWEGMVDGVPLSASWVFNTR